MTELDPYRLPRVAIPHHYDLTLAPDLGLGTFAGTVVIDLDIGHATRDLWCNAIDLVFVSATIDHGGGTTPLQTQSERDTERVRFVADHELSAGPAQLPWSAKDNWRRIRRWGMRRFVWEQKGRATNTESHDRRSWLQKLA